MELAPGLNMITGETGAGKSILLGATGLILGSRADKKVQYAENAKTIVEGTFTNMDASLHDFFQEHDLDFSDEIIIRREISATGKSRAFINDTPVNLQILQSLSGHLVDLHQQFDTLELQGEKFQMDALDAIAGHQSLLKKYGAQYQEWKSIKNKIRELRDQEAKAIQEQDFLQFQYKELEEADLSVGEQLKLEEEQGMLAHAESIMLALQKADNLLEEGQQPVLTSIGELVNELSGLAEKAEQMKDLYQKLESIHIDLQEWHREASAMTSDLESNPSRLQEINDRLDLLFRLQRKHSLDSEDALISLRDEIGTKLHSIDSLESEIKKLDQQRETLETNLEKKAETLHKGRKKAATLFVTEVSGLLKNLYMENARLDASVEDANELLSTGKDKVQFLFAANKGGTLLPIKKVASGGELSRLSLCIKSCVAGKMSLPTLIFDEIDSGISGEVAVKMGKMLKALAQQHQILMITHSPQIASIADKHFFVRKKDTASRTMASVEVLEESGRVLEIAKMLSGDPPSDSAILNAKELMQV